MAFHLSLLSPAVSCSFTRLPVCNQQPSILKLSFGRSSSKTVRCMSTDTIVRRDANYGPPIWKSDFIQSLSNKYAKETHKRRADELKEEVRFVLAKEEDTLTRFELVDALQRLGVSYHFEEEIKRILDSIWENHFTQQKWNNKDLYATALAFRLFRQHGYDISQEVFNAYKDENGNFKKSLSEDTMGMLYLYEASFLSVDDESIMDEARDFTTKHLKENLIKKNIDKRISPLVSHALELPLHWRMKRLEARWFIDVYETLHNSNPLVLALAKYDYNIVQAIYQDDVRELSKWWEGTCWGEKLSFARDRLMENFLWTIGCNYKPQFTYYRRMLAKVTAFLGTIDDIYDVYGTVEELELFTKAIESWDVNAMEDLPDYMKICFLEFQNSSNGIAYDILLEKGINIIPYLKKAWKDTCGAFLGEAKWYHSGYVPTMKEYMNNSWISMSASVTLTHSYFICENNITEEGLESLKKYAASVRWSALILRLTDDLGTSSDELKRGDNPKSIQCYMHETGASEEEAREHLKGMILDSWKKMNKDRVAKGSPYSHTFNEIAVDLARMSHCLYEFNDGHATQDSASIGRVLSLVVDPVPLGDSTNGTI